MGPTPATAKYGVTILTSDPVSGVIEAAAKGGALLRISVITTPVAFRWPVAGEAWVVRQENGTWILDSPYPQTGAPVTIDGVAPGDAVLNAPTGKVWILGSSDGSTDFSFSAASFPAASLVPAVRGRATLVAGTVTVPSTAVKTTSDIILTPQDNNTVGALRVSARTQGVSFVITSSVNTDSGVVAYLIYE